MKGVPARSATAARPISRARLDRMVREATAAADDGDRLLVRLGIGPAITGKALAALRKMAMAGGGPAGGVDARRRAA